jgi:hypothetical protein
MTANSWEFIKKQADPSKRTTPKIVEAGLWQTSTIAVWAAHYESNFAGASASAKYPMGLRRMS